MTSFKFWHDEIADIPEKNLNGDWYDLETGILYDPAYNYKRTERKQASQKTKDFRAERHLIKYFLGYTKTEFDDYLYNKQGEQNV